MRCPHGAVDAIPRGVVGSAAVPGFERLWHERAVASARQALGEEPFEAAWKHGRAMSVDQAIAAGLAAVGLERPAAHASR